MKQIRKIFMNKNTALIFYVLAAFGIVLMLFPHSGTVRDAHSEDEVREEDKADTQSAEQRLEQLLSLTEGAGQVRVMITYKNNGKITVAENKTAEESSDTGLKRVSSSSDVVLNGENKPVVISEEMPQIEGVLIVAQGGANIEVKNALIRAAEALLDVEPHKIEVLKMKTEG